MKKTAGRILRTVRPQSGNRLNSLILFVTSRCNAACRTCFYHEQLNREGDLRFEQIEKISSTMPSVSALFLSGGEPTLRKDLPRIIELFARQNSVRRLIFPTNALIRERVYEVVENALRQNPGIEELYLNVALDGYGKTHDRIRGVPGNWEKTLDCIEFLYPLKDAFGDRFKLNVNTVICSENYMETEKLSEFLWNEFRLDAQFFNIVRGDTPSGDEIKEIPSAELPDVYRRAAVITQRYAGRMFAAGARGRRFIKKLAYIGTILTHYRHQHSNFYGRTKWSFPCTAGETIAVIDHNGDVRACELLEKFASLKDFQYDFSRLWKSRRRRSEVERIDGGRNCWCTHVCFIHESLRHSKKGLLVDVPKNYVKRGNWK